MAEAPGSASTSIVLVHGGFVDGSGWEGVYQILRKDGYEVSVVQNPTISLAGDVVETKRIIAAQKRPVILVGHSYGGAVITQAGNDPNVVGLVYIAGFAPDKGESLDTIIKSAPPGAPVPPSFHQTAGSWPSTRRSSARHSQPTSTRRKRPSWPIRRSRGGWRRSAHRSASLRGERSRVGTWSPPPTG